VDENDANATPAAPGGVGFSLREAINYANATAGRQSIFVPSGYAISLTGTLPQPTDAAGLDVIGDGALLDGAATSVCIKVNASNNRYFGFEIRNCANNPVQVSGGSGNQFTRCYIHDNANGVVIAGSNNTFGPYNDVVNNGARGIEVNGPSTVSWNRVYGHTGQGMFLAGAADGSLLLGNVFYDNGIGIDIGNLSNGHIVVHNTVHASGTNGVLVGSNCSGTVLRNNIISGSGSAGVAAGDGNFATIDHNDFFGNVGDCSNCTTLGPGSRTDDPKYMDAAAHDLRPAPGSPLIDAGVVLSYDVNGPAVGNYNGSAPDIGACEAP
jgi:hypothetical protein